jgi:hypothetical protein
MMSQSVSDYIVERLSPIYPVATGVGPDVGSAQELLKRWCSAEGINCTNQALFDRYTLAGASGASLQDKAYSFWSEGLLKSGVRLPGTVGNYISTPDSTVNSITGDIDIRFFGKSPDWTSTAMDLVSKYDNIGNHRSYMLQVTATGVPQLWYAQVGTTALNQFASIPAPAVDGQPFGFRVTVDVDNGLGQHVITFYTSPDYYTWTILGAVRTVTGVINLWDGTAPLIIGARGDGNEPFNGTVYHAEVRNGIEGPIVAKFDSSQIQVTGTQVPASVPGWTLNGTGLIKRDDYVRLPGVSGNYISMSAASFTSPIGDLELVAKIQPDDWTPSLNKVFITKWVDAGNQGSFAARLRTDGTLGLYAWVNGGLVSVTSSAATGFTDGVTKYIKITRQASTGNVNFYSSDDGVSWSLIGLANRSGAAGALTASTAPLEVGSYNLGTTDYFAGNVYYAEVRNGIDGPVVASFDARDIETPWTMNGAGWSYEGTNFLGKDGVALSLPGTNGNYASTPDSAALSITGDLDIRVKAALDNWHSGAIQYLVAKRIDPSQRSYYFRTNAAGSLEIGWTADGSTLLGLNSQGTPGLANGEVKWVRVTLDVDNGAAGRTANFYLSDDGITWDLFGTNTTAGVTSIFDSTSAVEIGTGSSGFSPAAGKIYYAEIRNGIDGPIVARFDASAVAKTGTRLPATVTQVPGGNSANLLTPNQASIETDATGWAVDTNCTIARSTTQALDGTASLELTSIAAGQMRAKTHPGTTGGFPVVGGKAYTAIMSGRAAVTPVNMQININWYDAAGIFISVSTPVAVADTTSSWTVISNTAVAPATARFAVIYVQFTAVGIGEVHYVDRISLVETFIPWALNGTAWDWVTVDA